MKTSLSGHVDHCAIPVVDIQWHISFFKDVFGMKVREQRVSREGIEQVWMNGGMQFNRVRMAPEKNDSFHIGIMVENVSEKLNAAFKFEGVKQFYSKYGWIILPEGLIIEMIQGKPSEIGTHCEAEY